MDANFIRLPGGFLQNTGHWQHQSVAMFPLSCAHVLAHTGHEISAHKKTWSTHKFSFKNCVCTCLTHGVIKIDEA